MADNKENKDKNKKKTKKVKESIEKAIIRNLPADDIRWIIQPLSITMMRADLSPIQINIIVELIDKFQEKITEQIKNKEEERLKSPSLFTEEEIQQGKYTTRIPLVDLEVRPDAYDELHKAAIALQKMPIQMPVVKSDGTVSLAIFNLFSRISIPMLEGYKYKSGQRRAGYIELTMDSDNFDDVIRLGSQYTKYIKSVTRNRRCKYTSRIYMFISTYKVFGKWTIPFMEFHSMLGFSYRDEKTKEYVILSYAQFSDLRRSVLDKSKKELEKMALGGKSDCYFDYEPIFPRGKTKGFPEKICFYIYSSDFGKSLIADNKTTSENIQIENFLKKDLKQTPTNCRKLMNLLTDENRVGFQQKMKMLKEYCDNPAHKVENVRSYCWQSLTDYLEAHQPTVEEIPNTKEESGGEGASVGDSSGTNAASPTSGKDLPQEIPMSEEDQKRWDGFMECAKKDVSEQTFQTWFKPIRFVSFTDSKLLIEVPTKFFYEFLEEKYLETIKKSIVSGFGAGVQLMYNLAAK